MSDILGSNGEIVFFFY